MAWAAITTVPMGWMSAVGCMQMVVRRLVFGRELTGVDPATEVRKDRPLPAGDDLTVVCLDSMDQIRHIKKSMKSVKNDRR